MGDVVLLFLERFQSLSSPETDCPGPDRLPTRSAGTAFPVARGQLRRLREQVELQISRNVL